MDISSGGEYEGAAGAHLCLTIDGLNEALKKHRIADRNLRQRVCADFIFNQCYGFDVGWFEHGGTRLYPRLCFAERAQGPERSPGDVRVLHIQPPDYDLHESAFGNADWYFEDLQEDASGIENGT